MDFSSQVKPLRDVVAAPPTLARRLAHVGIIEDSIFTKSQQDCLAPGQKVVSLQGDIWRWDGFCLGAENTPSEAVRRLEHVNRHKNLELELNALLVETDQAVQAQERHLHTLAESLKGTSKQESNCGTAKKFWRKHIRQHHNVRQKIT